MYEQQVKNGMAFLDQRFPDWLYRVNVETLDLVDCEYCVLGQLCGDYEVAATALKLGYIYGEEFRNLAFIGVPSTGADTEWEDQNWEELTKEWKCQIIERRAREAASQPAHTTVTV